MKEIYIDWSGPYEYDDVISNNKEKISKYGFTVKPDDFGLYQIYGSHPVYGSNVLIYIGKTEAMFMNRLKMRHVLLNNEDFHNTQIYLGKIYYDDTLEHTEIAEDISMAESLLIHYHTPAKNSSNINSLKYADKEYRVINVGTYRSLQKEISTTAFTQEAKIFNLIDEIAQELKITEIYNEEDGYGFDINETTWFGVDYTLWSNDTTLVLEANKQLDMSFCTYEIIDNIQWYYKPIYGAFEQIIEIIKQYR